ncbi:MAG: prephenate dehydrogenase [Actinomycetota bacterium]
MKELPEDALPGVVLVVGAGLMGTSIGMALSARGVKVFVTDISVGAAALAGDLQAGHPLTEGVHIDPDVVVVATPPQATADVVVNSLRCYPQAVVTDMASVKKVITEQIGQEIRDVSRYVGGHPMAGRERTGASAARGDLFVGRPWILTPDPTCDTRALRSVQFLAESVGARVSVMTPAEHDVAVAAVSHLPQVAASLVAAQLSHVPLRAVALAGPGLRDVTRIAASDPGLWTQILGSNAEALVPFLKSLRGELDQVIGSLVKMSQGSETYSGVQGETISRDLFTAAQDVLAQMIISGQRGRARLPGKHGAEASRYETIVALISDEIGQLGHLLTDVGALGVSVEDVRVDHGQGRQVGSVELDVVPSVAAGLADSLGRAGWVVHRVGSEL